jgi:hypothetical protein
MKSILLPALVLLALPRLSAAELEGRYVLQNAMEIASELLLLPNHTFDYVLTYGAADYYAKGIWNVDGDSVVLTSSGSPAPPFKFVRSEAGKAPGIHVWVKAPNGDPVENIEVVLQSGKGPAAQLRTNGQGEAVFAGGQAPQSVILVVRVYGAQGGPFPVNPAHNNFYFEINGEAITRVPFQNEHLKIKGNSLEMRFWNRDKPMNYDRS